MYDYDCSAEHSFAIFESSSPADPKYVECGFSNLQGGVIGTSEWIWMTEEWGRRICAALNYFINVPTEKIEEMTQRKEKK